MRSCKDEKFLDTQWLLTRIHAAAAKHGLQNVQPDVANLLSHATQEKLRTLMEKMSVVAEHRLETYKNDHRFETTTEVKPQLKFLEEVDALERKRHEEVERGVLLRAAKSRSKAEDPEQAKLKEKAKALQQAEMEEMRQREANLTALAAIGPRKQKRLDLMGSSHSGDTSSGAGSSKSVMPMRPRIKRVNLRDLIFLMEQDKQLAKSYLLYKAYLK
jgi:transcription initiation factor TFIID subunit 4